MKKQHIKTLLSLYFLMLIFLGQVFADTIPDGSIVYGTWDVTNSPYVIMGEVEVPIDCTLIIEPGVRVKMLSTTVDSSFYINTLGVGLLKVNGRIIAEGTETDTIYFERTGEGRWGSVSILDSSGGINIIRYCKVSYGRDILHSFGIEYKGGLVFFDSKGVVEHSVFEYNMAGIIFMRSNIDMQSSICRNSSTGVYINSCFARITGNSIYNNYRTGISSRSANSLLSNNIIENNGEIGIRCYETNDTIVNNIVRNNLWGGINITRSEAYVMGNIIYGSNSGIRCNDQPYLINNTIVNNNYFGIYTDYAATPIILNSIIYGNQYLMTGLTYLDTVIFANCLVQVDTLPEGSIDGGGNIYNQDPCFASISEHEFSLTMNSPCIDMGTSFFMWENDTILDLSPDEYSGNAPDMGAVESLFTGINNEKLEKGSDLLSQNYPNPFSGSTKIIIVLKDNDVAMLEILDLSGNYIYSCELSGKGEHSVIWNGTDSNGSKVVPGIYISVLTSGDGKYWKPMILTD